MRELLTKASYNNHVTEREKKNLKIAYEAACESVVLLENDGALPIQGKRVALYGAGASHTIKSGTGSGEVNERHSVTILEGMKQAGLSRKRNSYLSVYDGISSSMCFGTVMEYQPSIYGLKKGVVMEDDLKCCCSNVVRAILDSNIQKEYIEKK